MLSNEKHEFSAGWRAAQKGGLAGSTTGQASGQQGKKSFFSLKVRVRTLAGESSHSVG